VQSVLLVGAVVIQIIDGVAGAIHFIVVVVSTAVVVAVVVTLLLSSSFFRCCQHRAVHFFCCFTFSLQAQSASLWFALHSHISRHPMRFHVNITIIIVANIITIVSAFTLLNLRSVGVTMFPFLLSRPFSLSYFPFPFLLLPHFTSHFPSPFSFPVPFSFLFPLPFLLLFLFIPPTRPASFIV